jgi:alkylation response protein AidB-like acyl-CoA dehydrogenase
MELFFQEAPALGDVWSKDASMRQHLRRHLGAEGLAQVEPALARMSALASGPMLELARRAEANPPKLVQYGSYGRRVDRLELDPAWKELGGIAAREGLVAIPWERPLGSKSRLLQLALLNMYAPSSAFFACPLAMSDGAVAALSKHGGGAEFAQRAVRRLTSRDPAQAWTSGQWMTEKEGGSDVSRSSTRAVFEGGEWRLYGTKYFTSSTASECTLALARPEGAGAGSGALALFYVEPWRADGTLNGIEIRRLKDKLGTRALPTAELELVGAVAHPVGEVGKGVRKVASVLNIARAVNTSAALSFMRRALDWAVAYAQVREAWGKRLAALPLHLETLAELQVEYDAALAVSVRLAELLGKVEGGEASKDEELAWRLLTPLAKLGTGKQVVSVTSEVWESFGGAGYVEDTGIPILLRDAQVLPIWEGTTNVLSLDAQRAMAEGSLEALLRDLGGKVAQVQASAPGLGREATLCARALGELGRYAQESLTRGSAEQAQTVARSFALSLYRTTAAVLLCEAAAWEGETGRFALALRRWTRRPLLDLWSVEPSRAEENLRLLHG